MKKILLAQPVPGVRAAMNVVIFQGGDLRKEIITSGGGADSELWRQIQADIFQVPVKTVVGGSEGAAFGAALTAGVTWGMWSSLQDSISYIKVESELQPNIAG